MPAEPVTVRLPLSDSGIPFEPDPEVRAAAAKCPVSKIKAPDDSMAWLITGFSEAREVLVDPGYSRALLFAPGRTRVGADAMLADTIVALDPPEHSRLRKLVAGAFTKKRIEALRPRVTQIVNELIDGMLAGPRPADLVDAFCLPLPSQVICLLLGVPPEDNVQFREWISTALGDWNRPQEEVAAAWGDLIGYMSGLIARKRENPGDDLISVLTDARDSADQLSENELVAFCIVLLGAGYETTANELSLSFAALCQNPDQLGRLRADTGLIPNAVEELLRYVVLLTGGGTFARVTREEVCLGGVTIPAGETVIPAFAIANRDSSAFEDPDRLDVGREVSSHLGFGAGAHHCLGAQLARMELQEAYRGLLTRLPGLRIAVPVPELEFREGQLITSIRVLPVTWDGA